MPAKKDDKTNSQYISMPNSFEAEQSVLCCLLRDVDNQGEILGRLVPDDFYTPRHQVIFEVMAEIPRQTHMDGEKTVRDTINFATVVDALTRRGKLQEVGDVEYIVFLNDRLLPGTANADEYVGIVKRASTMRKLINICGEVQKRAYSTASSQEVITYAEEQIFNLSQGDKNGGLIPLADVAARTLFKISERYINPDLYKGVETGFKQFDRLTNGLHGGELIVLAARPGAGKSAMAMNIVENVAKMGKTAAVFSLEMSNEQLVERMMSSMSSVPLQFIKNGQLPNGDIDLARLRTAQDTISSKMHIYGNDYANIKPSEIASQCRVFKEKHGLDLIVIDYIQLMSSDLAGVRDSSRQEEVQSITRSLKLLAKQLDVPVIALSQLKRDAEIRTIKGEKGANEPVLSDLRESGAIEQDADIVLFIHKLPKEQVTTYTHNLIVAKHRNGENDVRIPLHWLSKFVHFVDDDYLAQLNIKLQPQVEQDTVEVDAEDLAETYIDNVDMPFAPDEDFDDALFVDDDDADNK